MSGQPITLEFDGGGTLIEDIRELAAATRGLSDVHAKAQAAIQSDLSKSADKAIGFARNVDAAADIVVSLGREAARGGAAQLGKSLDASAKSAAQLGSNMEKAGRSALQAGQQGARGAQQLGRGIVLNQQQAQQAVKLTAEQYRIIQEEIRAAGIESEEFTQTIAEAVAELAEAGVTADDLAPSIEPAVDSVESLQRQLRAAKKEAGALAAEFGLDSEQAIAAQRRVAELTDEVGDLNARFDAFNPDKKFDALNQVVFSLQGGLFATQSLIQSIAGENEGLQKSIGFVQTLLFASQGLQTLVGGLGDSLKTLRASLLGAAAAQEAQAVAAGASATATAASGTAAAGASGGFRILTTSVRAFTVSLLTNPIFLAVTAIAALGAAIFLAGEEAETAAAKTEKWLAGFDKARDARARLSELSGAVRAIKREEEDLDIGESLTGRAAALAKRNKEDIALLNAEVDQIFREQQQLLRQAESVGIIAERGVNQITGDAEIRVKNLAKLSDDQREALEQISEKFNDLTRQSGEISQETYLLTLRSAVEQRRLQQEITQAEAANARERKDIARSLAQELLDAQRDLQTRLLAATAEEGGSRAAIELERENSLREIAELERGFQRKLALIELQKRLSTQAWKDLSEAEREARADQLIASGQVSLSAKQQEDINTLRLLAEESYLRNLDALYTAQAKERLALIADTSEREREQFELDLEERSAALRKAGVAELEIVKFQKRERQAFEQTSALAAIELDQRIAEARVNAQRQGNEREADFERRKQLQLLVIREQAARASLAAIADDGSKESQLLRAQFEQVIAETEQARARLLAQVPERSLLSLLGVRQEDEARVRESLNGLLASTQQIIAASNAARQDEVRNAIAATDAIIGDAQRRRSELQSELEQALQDQRDGYANNADAIRREIEKTKEAERSAVDEKRRQQQELIRLQRQQVLADAAAQGSSLTVAIANLIKSWSTLPFGVGLLSAFAQAGALVAFITQTRARIAQVSRGQQFRRGGRLERSTLVGPLHEEGGIALLDRRTGHYYGEAEGGEGIVSRDAMQEHGDMVHAMNMRDFANLRRLARIELERAGYMVLNPSAIKRMQAQSAGASAPASALGTAEVLAELSALRQEVVSFRDQEGSRERVAGNTIRHNQHTITRR